MKLFEVELTITQTFTTRVVIEGDFKDEKDPIIETMAKDTADNMYHDHWNYKDTEFDIMNVLPVPESFSPYKKQLLKFGYSLDRVKTYSEEQAESELQALGYLK